MGKSLFLLAHLPSIAQNHPKVAGPALCGRRAASSARPERPAVNVGPPPRRNDGRWQEVLVASFIMASSHGD